METVKAAENMRVITCKSPVNIALIKYWGKRDEELMLPLNDSISITLDNKQMCARTTIATAKSFTGDRIWLNRTETSVLNPRIQNCIKYVREMVQKDRSDEKDWHVHICSENNFPTAAGLASSAAGYACLAFSFCKLFYLNANVSEMARLGSGSACRSVHGGFVHWKKGVEENGSDSIAYQIAPASHWPDLRILILVVNDERKPISSTHGMQCSVKTSTLLKYRVESVVEERVKAMIDAIKIKDFETFSTITMQVRNQYIVLIQYSNNPIKTKESNQLHAICLDTWPPITYLNDVSRSIIQLVCKYNELSGKNKVAYTFDAGPNAFLFILKSELPKVLGVINHFFPSDDSNFLRGIPVDISEISAVKTLISQIKLNPQKYAIKYIIHTQV
uniref:Diphosphomevalonate decarboxylase n=1 Tax=Strigamia maritima TaxID=126957 RepID=T1J535_STRMM